MSKRSRFSVAAYCLVSPEQTAKRPHFIYAQACFMASFDAARALNMREEDPRARGSRTRVAATNFSSLSRGCDDAPPIASSRRKNSGPHWNPLAARVTRQAVGAFCISISGNFDAPRRRDPRE